MEKDSMIFAGHKIRILEDSVFIDSKILVLGDLHLGYEELYSAGGNISEFQLNETKAKLERIVDNIKKARGQIKKIVITGDLVHNFGFSSNLDFENLRKFLYFLEKLNKKENIIFIKGNHDTTSGIILKRLGFRVKEYYKIKDILFLHGDKYPKKVVKNIKLLVMGHLHPIIRLRDNYKEEKYKCFLIGMWEKTNLLIIPSFMPFDKGYNLNKIEGDKKKSSFFDVKILKKFEVVIYNNKEEKYYNFGKLKKLI